MSENSLSRMVLNNGMSIPPIILGSFQVKSERTLDEMVDAALTAGCTGFDTSPSYGTEIMLGKTLYRAINSGGINREALYIQSKIDGWQMQNTKGNVEKFVDDTLRKMKLEYIDLLMIHWPFLNYLDSTWENLTRINHSGKVLSIGVCNSTLNILEYIINLNIAVPQVVQNEISPLNTANKEIEYFQSKGVIVQAYSPLARMLPEIQNSEALNNIAREHDKSIAQIILRWHVDRSVVPVFSSTNNKRIKSNIDIFDFSLNPYEIQLINRLDKHYHIFPLSYGCPSIF